MGTYLYAPAAAVTSGGKAAWRVRIDESRILKDRSDPGGRALGGALVAEAFALGLRIWRAIRFAKLPGAVCPV